jgi:hypothetical protein
MRYGRSWGSKALGIRSCNSVAQAIVSALVIRSSWAKVSLSRWIARYVLDERTSVTIPGIIELPTP